MGEQERKDWMKGVVAGLCEEVRRYRTQLEIAETRLEAVEESEKRLADIVERSLELHVFVFENPKVVADGYYIDAKTALEKRPSL